MIRARYSESQDLCAPLDQNVRQVPVFCEIEHRLYRVAVQGHKGAGRIRLCSAEDDLLAVLPAVAGSPLKGFEMASFELPLPNAQKVALSVSINLEPPSSGSSAL